MSNSKSIPYSYPLRENFMAQFVLPVDLTEQEAKKISAFLRTLVIKKQEIE
jgi:hypothetical protein